MSNTIQIKVIIEGGFLHDGVQYTKGDVSTEPTELGTYFCRAGWAEDTAGIVPTASPNSNEVVLLVDSTTQPSSIPGVI